MDNAAAKRAVVMMVTVIASTHTINPAMGNPIPRHCVVAARKIPISCYGDAFLARWTDFFRCLREALLLSDPLAVLRDMG